MIAGNSGGRVRLRLFDAGPRAPVPRKRGNERGPIFSLSAHVGGDEMAGRPRLAVPHPR